MDSSLWLVCTWRLLIHKTPPFLAEVRDAVKKLEGGKAAGGSVISVQRCCKQVVKPWAACGIVCCVAFLCHSFWLVKVFFYPYVERERGSKRLHCALLSAHQSSADANLISSLEIHFQRPEQSGFPSCRRQKTKSQQFASLWNADLSFEKCY